MINVEEEILKLSPEKQVLYRKNAAEMLLNNEIRSAEEYLRKTDYKDLPSYKPKPGESLTTIIAERDLKRDFIRNNKE
jgi:hypothetical protein